MTVFLGDDLSDNGILSFSLNSVGVLSDFLVNLLVKSFNVVNLGLLESGSPLAELLGELILVGLCEVIHITLDVETEDVFSVFFGVVLTNGLTFGNNFTSLSGLGSSLLEVISWESLGVVGNVDTSVNSTLEGSENSASGGGSNETNIEESLEWSSVLVDTFLSDIEEFSIS